MHLQEKTLFDIGLGIKVIQNVAYYHPHHVTYVPEEFEMTTSPPKPLDVAISNFQTVDQALDSMVAPT